MSSQSHSPATQYLVKGKQYKTLHCAIFSTLLSPYIDFAFPSIFKILSISHVLVGHLLLLLYLIPSASHQHKFHVQKKGTVPYFSAWFQEYLSGRNIT
jgi:hypothetical protein